MPTRRAILVPSLALLTALPALLAAVAAPAPAADWPHWRGPERTGVARDAGVPLAWGPEKNVLWKVALPGVSGSTPIVSGERVFVQVSNGDRIELWSVARSTGEVAWRRELDGGNEKKRKGDLSSPSPVAAGGRVWTVTGTGVVKAFDLEGRELWSRALQADYGKFGILHGYASSPLLVDDTLYIQVLHGFYTDDPSYVLALDAATGATKWRVERPSDAPREAPDAYTTPALLERSGRREIVVSGADYVTGHDPATGKELWRVPGLNPTANPIQRIVASPIVSGRSLFVPSRVAPLLALEAGEAGAPAVRWSLDRGPDVPTPALDGDRLYILTDRGVVTSLDAATGEPVWGPERVADGPYSASPVVAGGRVYVTNEAGLTTVFAAGPEFEVLAENDLAEHTLSSLAIADGRIFLRTSEHLWCIGRE